MNQAEQADSQSPVTPHHWLLWGQMWEQIWGQAHKEKRKVKTTLI